MVAIVTNKLKRTLTQELLNQFTTDSDQYFYIGVGRSEDWNSTDTAPTPTDTDRTRRQFRYGLQSVKKITGASFVIPRYNWISGSTYTAFNDNVVGQPANSYYVLTEENNVYLCVRQGKDSNGNAKVSTVKPDHTDTSLPVEVDGYIWKFLYTITTANANAFLSAAYMPVTFVDSAVPTDPLFSQYAVQNAAVPGQIVGYRVTNSGSGYTSDPTITIVGDGTNARARPVLASNTLVGVEVDDSAGGIPLGSNYSYASVSVTGGGGSNATVVPIFSPENGLGADAREDLRASAVMFNVRATGDEAGDWVVANDFRQIGLLKNITYYNSNTLFDSDQGRALKKMRLSSVVGSFDADDLITGGASSAQAYVDYFEDSVGNTGWLWYHQSEDTGFKPFEDGETISISTNNAVADSASIAPEINPFSGDLLFLDNRATPITRTISSTEDFKIIIQL